MPGSLATSGPQGYAALRAVLAVRGPAGGFRLRWNESDTKVNHDLWAERCWSDGSRHARLMAARCAAAGLGFGSPSLHRLVGGGGFGLAGRAVLRRTAESARHAEARCVWRERGHVGPWVHGRARGWGRVVRVGPPGVYRPSAGGGSDCGGWTVRVNVYARARSRRARIQWWSLGRPSHYSLGGPCGRFGGPSPRGLGRPGRHTG